MEDEPDKLVVKTGQVSVFTQVPEGALRDETFTVAQRSKYHIP